MLKNRAIDIECCQDCQFHQSIVRHNQQNYLQLVNQLRRQLQQHGLQLIKNRLPNHLVKENTKSEGLPPTMSLYRCIVTQKLRLFPRVGSFEIRYGKLLLFSKLQVEQLPTVRDIMTLLFFVAREEKEDVNLMKLQKYNDEKIMKEGGNCLYKDIFEFKDRFLKTVESKKENIAKRVQSVKKVRKVVQKNNQSKGGPDTERAVLTTLTQNEDGPQPSRPRTFRRHCTLVYRLEPFANGEPLVQLQPSQFAPMTKNHLQDEQFSLSDMPVLQTRKKLGQPFGTLAKIAPLTRMNSRDSLAEDNCENNPNRYYLTKQQDISVDSKDEIVTIEDSKVDTMADAKKILVRNNKQPELKTSFNLPSLPEHSTKSIEQTTKKTIVVNTNNSIQHKSSRMLHQNPKDTPVSQSTTPQNHSSSFGQAKNQQVKKSLTLAMGHRINVHRAPRPSQQHQAIERHQNRLPTHTSEKLEQQMSSSSQSPVQPVSPVQHIKLTLQIHQNHDISRPETSSRKKRPNLSQTVNTYLKYLESTALQSYLKQTSQTVYEQPVTELSKQSSSSSQLIEQLDDKNHSMIREVSQHRECDSDREETRPTSHHYQKNPTCHSASVMNIFQMPKTEQPLQMEIQKTEDKIPRKMQNVFRILALLNYPLKNVVKCFDGYEVWLKDPIWQPTFVRSNCQPEEILSKVIQSRRNIDTTSLPTLINIITGCPSLEVNMTDKKQFLKIISNFEKDKKQARLFVYKSDIVQIVDVQTTEGINKRLLTLQMQKNKRICMLEPDIMKHFTSVLLVHYHPENTFSQISLAKQQKQIEFRVVSELQKNSSCYIQIDPGTNLKIHSSVEKLDMSKRELIGSVTRKGSYYFSLKLDNQGRYALNLQGQWDQITVTFYSLGNIKIIQRDSSLGQRLNTFSRILPAKEIDDSAPVSDSQL